MVFKLTKAQAEDLSSYITALREKQEQIEEAVSSVNQSIVDLIEGSVLPLVDEYNNTLNEARNLVSVLADDMRSEFDEKSEAWQQGDKGSAVEEFISAFENVSLDDVEASEMPNISVEFSGDEADQLENLPAEV